MTDFTEDIESCLETLRRGGIILYPTDTIWGIGCDATDAAAVQKVFQLKQRQETKSLIVLMADERDLLKHVTQPDLRVFDYLHKTQRPTTVIYEGAIGLATNIIGEDGSLAIRLVNEPFCKHLIKRLRKPLVSTSANISGNPSPQSFAMIDPAIKDGVDYVVRYRQDDHQPGKASTLVKWEKNGVPTIVRA